ncbi:helix-turn-helix transcriptional regulator [Paraburkholderia terrae]|uniref:helix-turn-helix transcriptional regulator n=1 Tax=Paraburkholderia terrae TaxID=311230 RepID=UPI00296B1257|nr:transcriptional regulator [Paraburkholderia terrae]MDW3660279.1 transcriptional regulator [Paraburkholderia terrae]
MKKTSNASPIDQPAIPVLPSIGFSQWAQIAPFVPMGRETWRKLVRAGKAPQPTYFSKTCAAYRNSEILEYLADPLNYTADVVAAADAA